MTGIQDETIWKIIETYFADNPQSLVRHHIDSYNDFFNVGLQQMFKEMNPLKIELDYNEEKEMNMSKCYLYFGGKDASKIYYGKPTIYENESTRFLFPNECRLRNMTYGMSIHYDIDIEIERTLEPGEDQMLVDENNQVIFDEDEENDDEESDTEEKSKALTDKKMKNKLTPAQYATMKENMEKNMRNDSDNVVIEKMLLKDIYLGRFPTMVQSDYCILKGMSNDMRHKLGECKHDYGGYFIIDGKEKTVVCQEKFGDNMLRIGKSSDDKYSYTAELKSVSENASKYIRSLSIRIVEPHGNIVVSLPNVRKPVPLFTLFRALGISSDKTIIEYCTLQFAELISPVMAEYLNASIHDAGNINNQEDALKYISLLMKQRTHNTNNYNEEHIAKVLHMLADYFLPHVGEMNFTDKAFHLGNMVYRLLMVAMQIDSPTDRDHYKFKRVETVGTMLRDLVKENYKAMQIQLRRKFEIRYEYHKSEYKHPAVMFEKEYRTYFKDRDVEKGVMKGFKGSWGKKVGVTQDLNRLSYNGMISHLRKTSIPIDNVKIVGPHMLHSSQWGFIDPMDTPDGGNIGIHKYLSIMTIITRNISREPLKKLIEEHSTVIKLSQCLPALIGIKSKIVLNGLWIGVTTNHVVLLDDLKLHRRHALIPITTSITYHYSKNTIEIFTDGGRLMRPIFYFDNLLKSFAFENEKEWSAISSIIDKYEILKSTGNTKDSLWNKLTCGFHEKIDEKFDPFHGKVYKWEDLYSEKVESNRTKKAILEYIDANETESSLIALNSKVKYRDPKQYTHMELHESTILGVMSNMVIYPQHNPLSRNCFSCGQSKQAVSLYHTNFQMRMDKTAVVLNYGQVPLVKSEYLQHINQEEMPYGENAVVAIMCYTGYNVEDAILVNEASLKRGLFRTTYYSTYETHEEKEVKNGELITEKIFGNIQNEDNIIGTTIGYDYNKLDNNGLIPENTPVDDKTVLIGMSGYIPGKEMRKDVSKKPKKGQLGVVDKSFMTEDEEGRRIAKVRIREERIPTFGDKFSSRAGQKGTIGMIIPEEDMPFSKNGIRPDIIINPHALPSRMTIGQLIESVVGKACAIHGAFGNCTAFRTESTNLSLFGELLTHYGYHSTGNEIMYNGMNGQQIETEIFMGPTYYMRLKHMVKDKINFRARGPNTNITRQPVSGRANDGGLRIGEMERDAIVAHGATAFLRESMLDRADDYKMAICNQTGSIAIYNPKKNIMLSPSIDGPLKYTKTIDSDEDIVQQISKFGRSFSIVRVPYSLKLLMQELLAINVKMSIITEDNVSQMENMKFSNNIDLLLGKTNATPNMVINQIKKILDSETAIEPLYDATPTPSPLQYRIMSPSTSPSSNEGSQVVTPTTKPPPRVSPLYAQDQNSDPVYSPGFDINANDSPGFDINANDSPGFNINGNDSPGFNINGNDSKNSDDVMTGGAVHYRGDIKPRVWVVNEKRAGEYIIETQDTDGLLPGDNVRKVARNDIYFPDDSFVYAQQNQLDIAQPYQDPEEMMFNTPMINHFQHHQQQQQQQQGIQSQPAINFAPVIRIVQGDDHSNTVSSDPVEELMQPPINNGGVDHVINNSSMEPVYTGNSERASPSEPENSIDFKNIKIIKTE